MLEIGIRDLWFPFRGQVVKEKQEEVFNKWSKALLHFGHVRNNVSPFFEFRELRKNLLGLKLPQFSAVPLNPIRLARKLKVRLRI